ncbi:MAG: GAF domain-containing protein [Ktedonobacterales bacterium]
MLPASSSPQSQPQPQPQRAGRSGYAERAGSSGGSPPPALPIASVDASAGASTAAPTLPAPTPAALNAIYAEALDGALSLVRADGGELFTLDSTGQAMVSRIRYTRPRIASPLNSTFGSALGPLGAPSRPSQPMRPTTGASSGRSVPGQPAPRSQPAYPLAGRSIPSPIPNEADDIEAQSTQVLAASALARAYQPGEGLVGYTWHRAEPALMSGEQVRQLPRGNAPPDFDAPWHLALPIYRPSTLTSLHPQTEVIGILTVYNRDPLWSFATRDIELLALHADRVARALQLSAVEQKFASKAEMLDALRELGHTFKTPQDFYRHVREIVGRLLDAPSFAVVRYYPQHDPQHDEAAYEYAELGHTVVAPRRLSANQLPAWWRVAQGGQTLCISTAADRAANPEYLTLGWVEDQRAQSLLAAPMIVGSQLVGALVVASPRSNAYTPDLAAAFESIAMAVAMAVENARLSEETQHATHQAREQRQLFSAYSNAAMTLNASLDVDATLQSLAEQASLFTAARVCGVFLLNEDQDTLVGAASYPRSDELPAPIVGARIPLSWDLLRYALNSQTYVVLKDLDDEWRDNTGQGHFLAQHAIRSFLALPVADAGQQGQQQLLGALLVFTPNQHRLFSPDEIGPLQGLAGQAAIAIANARLYQRLEHAFEQQKELDRLKDEFILTVSHEFRTPLTAIEGYVTLIDRHGQKLDQAKLSQFASEIHQATKQLAGMISTLADANRMSDHPLQLTLRPVNLRAAAEKAVATQAEELRKRIEIKIAPDHWALADEERLPLVFSNLITNAVKYAPEGFPYVISAQTEARAALAASGRPHAMGGQAPDRWLAVGVQDRGPGISSDDQAKLFQKFVRLTQSLTTSVRGTGLGLWICRQYLDAMGGDIWVESELARGATFRFSLPQAPAHP